MRKRSIERFATRRLNLPAAKRNPSGRGYLCRWCETPVKPPRRYWCSQACVDDYRERNDPQYQRRKLRERDGGICVLCGRDALRLKRIFDRARYRRHRWNQRHAEELLPPHRRPSWFTSRGIDPPSTYRLNREAQEAAVLRVVRWLGLDGAPPSGRTLWEADHIVPVVEGGGGTGLDNLRTLCWWCHKTETAKLARRRARARRPQLMIPGTDED